MLQIEFRKLISKNQHILKYSKKRVPNRAPIYMMIGFYLLFNDRQFGFNQCN